jgi:hypothetical protein
LNSKTYTTTVGSDSTWSVNVGSSDLASLVNGHVYSVAAGATDLAGNTASSSDPVTFSNAVTLAINPIDANGFISASNAASGIIISGTSGDQPISNLTGQSVTVSLNNKNYFATIQNNGTWSANIGSADLAALSDVATYTVTASVTDKVGKLGNASANVVVDESAGITINPIDGNGFINAANVANGIVVTGTSSDSVLANLAGQTIALSLNGESYNGVIQSDGTWAVNVGSAGLENLADGQNFPLSANVIDKAGNIASSTSGVTTDETASLSISAIDGNGYINAANAANGITITGTSSDSVLTNLAAQTVTVSLNGQNYAGLIQNDGTWSVHVGSSALSSLTDGSNYAVTASVTDIAGNTASAGGTVAVEEDNGEQAALSLNVVGFSPVDFSSQANFTWVGPETDPSGPTSVYFPGGPTGNQVLGGVPFDITSNASGYQAWNAYTASAGGNAEEVLTIPVGVYGVSDVYTLINTYWELLGPNSAASLIFNGSAGTTYTVDLVGNSDIRGWLLPAQVNGTSTTNVYHESSNGFTTGAGALDMQKIVLPSAFATQTLTTIELVDDGATGIQRTILDGVTVEQSPTVTPIGAAAARAVNFAIGGLDARDTGTVTFSDGTDHVTVNVDGTHTNYTANLTSLADGTITSSLALATDAAGNSFTPVAGTSTTLAYFAIDWLNWIPESDFQ